MQHLIDRWKSAENMDVERCAGELETLVGKVYIGQPTMRECIRHIEQHGPHVRIQVVGCRQCSDGWYFAHLSVYKWEKPQINASIPGIGFTLCAGSCVAWQWSDSRGLPVEAPGEKAE